MKVTYSKEVVKSQCRKVIMTAKKWQENHNKSMFDKKKKEIIERRRMSPASIEVSDTQVKAELKNYPSAMGERHSRKAKEMYAALDYAPNDHPIIIDQPDELVIMGWHSNGNDVAFDDEGKPIFG